MSENKVLSNEKDVTNFEVFKDLKRRVKTTRKARINASSRLRKKHEYFEKITHYSNCFSSINMVYKRRWPRRFVCYEVVINFIFIPYVFYNVLKY
jgi:hypothetical protein